MLAALPATRARIEASTGLARRTITKHLLALRAADAAHIGAWERAPEGRVGGGQWSPVYHAGPGPDVPCRFKPKTDRQRYDAFVRRARENGTLDTIMAKKRARYWKRKAATRGDPLVAALFGPRRK